jgi:hypothetical protein
MSARTITVEITDTEVDALTTAVGKLIGHRNEYPLISLLRKVDPGNETLAVIDQIARKHGYVQAGSDERLSESGGGQ